MYFRQLLNDETACASYLFGCKTESRFAVVDPHADIGGEYVRLAAEQGVPIVAVLETHVQAPTTSPGCPRSSPAPARRPTCPRAQASRSSTSRSPTGRC